MKQTCILLLAFLCQCSVFSQTVYNLTKDVKTNSKPFPAQCTNCQINIEEGVTLTVNSDIYLMNSSINGGSIEVKGKTITFWSDGQFNNTHISVNSAGSIVNSSTVTYNNTVVEFNNTSKAIVYSSVLMNASKMKFLDNSRMEATGGSFEMKNKSAIIVGDGNLSSKSNVRFNGATLYTYDQSMITMANNNNYYFNWSSYITQPNGLQINTLNNKLNCGNNGKNNCVNPNLYGPATLTISGFTANAMLPVKLSSFTLTAAQTSVRVRWRTELEENADRFVVQRSADGVYWQNAGEVKATGNSSVPVDYSFNDMNPGSPLVYYRLKMLDIDKRVEFSLIKSTTLGIQNNVNIYPNPAKDHIIISSGAPEGIQGVLLSDRGSLLKKFQGQNSVRVDLTGLTPGSYYIKVNTDSVESSNHKLIITR